MAVKRKKGDPKVTSFVGLDTLRGLWHKIPAQSWYYLLNELAPEKEWTLKGQSTILAKCPYHEDSTPSFSININKSLGKCFGCGKVVVDPISLVAHVGTGLTHHSALMLVINRFNLTNIFDTKVLDSINEYHTSQEMKKQAAIASRALLAKAIANEDDAAYEYIKPAINYLVVDRKLPKGLLGNEVLPVGVLGKPLHMKDFFTKPEYYELYTKFFEKYNNNNWWGSLLFPYNDSPGTISSFKLRKPTTASKEMAIINNDYGKAGVFGLYTYQAVLEKEQDIYLTEGEFDVLSVMAQQHLSGAFSFMVLATGGTYSSDISFLRKYNVKTIWAVPDHPAKNGDNWMLPVLNCKENFDGGKFDPPIQVKIFTWPPQILGSDLDEVIKLNDFEKVKKFLYTERNSYFINYYDWVLSRCDAEIERIHTDFEKAIREAKTDIEKQNLTEARLSDIKDRLLYWIGYLHVEDFKNRFIQYYTETQQLDLMTMSDSVAKVYDMSSTEGLKNRIYDVVKQHFSVAYRRFKSSAIYLAMYCKNAKNEYEFNITNTKLLEQLLATHVGDVVKWIDTIVGESPIFNDGITNPDSIQAIKVKNDNLRVLLEGVVQRMLTEAPSEEELIKFGQGIHHFHLPRKLLNQNYVYFVNGKIFMRGRIDESGDIAWEEIDNVTDGKYVLIDEKSREQWSEIETIDDMLSACKRTPKQIYDDIRPMLDGWEFKQHEAIADILAAYIMSLPIQNAVGVSSILSVTGERESGKSTLIFGLLGGTSNATASSLFPHPILESAVNSVDASAAAMYQQMSNMSLTYVMDEIEGDAADAGRSAKDSNNYDIIRLLYNVPTGGSVIKRGTPDNSRLIKYYVRMPVILAGIVPTTDLTFQSRILIVEMKKREGKESPADYISEKLQYTDTKISELRREITAGLIPYLLEIKAELPRMKARVKKLDKEKSRLTPDRFLNTILLPLIIYEKAGRDPLALYDKLYEIYLPRLKALNGFESHTEIIDAVLHSRVISIAMSDSDARTYISPRQLILSGQVQALNSEPIGIYVDAERRWLILSWKEIVNGNVFPNNSRFRYMAPAVLKNQVDRNSYVIKDLTRSDKRAVANLIGKDITEDSYTVLSLDYIAPGIATDLQQYYAKKEVTENTKLDDIKPVSALKEEIPLAKTTDELLISKDIFEAMEKEEYNPEDYKPEEEVAREMEEKEKNKVVIRTEDDMSLGLPEEIAQEDGIEIEQEREVEKVDSVKEQVESEDVEDEDDEEDVEDLGESKVTKKGNGIIL